MPVALITGASRGLGRALAHALARRGWSLIVDARRADDLADAMRGIADAVAVPGDVTAVLAAEEPSLRCYALDPGDMRTDMHQRAFPGEDISDRPEAGTVVPALLRLLDERPPNGRYRASDLAVTEVTR